MTILDIWGVCSLGTLSVIFSVIFIICILNFIFSLNFSPKKYKK